MTTFVNNFWASDIKWIHFGTLTPLGSLGNLGPHFRISGATTSTNCTIPFEKTHGNLELHPLEIIILFNVYVMLPPIFRKNIILYLTMLDNSGNDWILFQMNNDIPFGVIKHG
jgi:hypothetical protein